MITLSPHQPAPVRPDASPRPDAPLRPDASPPVAARGAEADPLGAALAAARHNVALVWAPGTARPEPPRREAEPLQDLLRRWVRVSVLWDERLLETPALAAYARRQARAGAQVRMARNVPVSFAVVDCDVSLVGPTAPEPGARPAAPPGPAVSGCPETVHLLHYLFLGLWEGAAPLRTEEPGRHDGQTRSVLVLLAQGLTDQQIAHRLQVCERTVGRVVARLMGELDARSRFEAGVRAARLGWLETGARPA
ncbi:MULTISPECIES: helix-turn-helix domain-containing protein [unclassified Streptomyces]|uniref:helix-turn-helix domain-containing protein n=1 Tax=unclassified Streptomyces TaxID=2593676 RepID=UPI0022B5E79A|nr:MULTISPECIES: LuxR C-terminal-related transcriptional regulator [unclassified Streptomyces]MCZ7414359.1 LuxR C-terminal-related transcriptional regulator [Streptomyces sp. WMMC897]MCZ7431314.1 LuxR C-terminal-related transcriptional regulator [Streptomyces sp. WMMC1477]